MTAHNLRINAKELLIGEWMAIETRGFGHSAISAQHSKIDLKTLQVTAPAIFQNLKMIHWKYANKSRPNKIPACI
jgi:hypothetical protein